MLAHLATTRLGGSLVAVLDNGSTDHTPTVLAEAAGLFPTGRFLTVRLPVNVGAPGARNWLLSLPEVKARPFVAFLDDDAFPEADWLARLLDTAARYPRAGAIGLRHCRPDAAGGPSIGGLQPVSPPDGPAEPARSHGTAFHLRCLPLVAGLQPVCLHPALSVGLRLLSSALPDRHRNGRPLRHPLQSYPVRRPRTGHPVLFGRLSGGLRWHRPGGPPAGVQLGQGPDSGPGRPYPRQQDQARIRRVRRRRRPAVAGEFGRITAGSLEKDKEL